MNHESTHDMKQGPCLAQSWGSTCVPGC